MFKPSAYDPNRTVNPQCGAGLLETLKPLRLLHRQCMLEDSTHLGLMAIQVSSILCVAIQISLTMTNALTGFSISSNHPEDGSERLALCHEAS